MASIDIDNSRANIDHRHPPIISDMRARASERASELVHLSDITIEARSTMKTSMIFEF